MAAMNAALLSLCLLAPAHDDSDLWVTYPGGEGPGAGKHIVLLAGDEEYRSEECMPMLGKLLSVHHGFKCTVLFSTNPETGEIDPKNQTNIPGMEVLSEADLVILAWRFRELPDEDMKYFVDYVESGAPIIGLRTSTHAFDIKRNKESKYRRYHWRNGEDWPGGFGKQILGETWVAHHGGHGSEATRGIVEEGAEDHPILNGLADVFGPTDVYRVNLPLAKDAQILMRGAVLDGMDVDSKPVENKKNEPMMPLIWTRTLPVQGQDAPQRVLCTTMGASQDFVTPGLRRVIVNGAFWCLRMEVPENATVDFVGKYEPTAFGFNRAQQGVFAKDHRLETAGGEQKK